MSVVGVGVEDDITNEIHVVIDGTVGDAVALVFTNNAANALFQSVCKHLGKDFVVGVEEGDRAPIGNVGQISLLWK